MSALLQGRPVPATGLVDTTDGTIAPGIFHNGLPYEVDGTLAVDDAGVIAFHHQGLPFTATGRLVVAIGGTVLLYGSGAAPIDVSGRLVMAIAAIASVSSGVGYDVAGRVAIAA